MEFIARYLMLSRVAKFGLPQGRVATKPAYEHLGLDYVEEGQPRLL